MLFDLPLHPSIVHIPLGLAVVVPLVALGLLIAIWIGKAPKRIWLVVIGLQLFMLGGGLLALRTGEGDEEKVEQVVDKQYIHTHETQAKQFLWGAVFALAVSLMVLAAPEKGARTVALIALLVSLGATALALRAGHSGGSLVYKHGAAEAHTESQTSRHD